MERASSSFGQWLRDAAQRSGLRAFWHWWTGELAPLMPSRLSLAVRRRRLRPIVAFERDVAVVWAPRVADGALAFAEVARVPLAGDPADAARIGHAAMDSLSLVAPGGLAAGPRVLVSLPASQVLRKTITLPAAVEGNLHETLAYDLDRLTPFKPEDVYFDATVIGRDHAKREIRIDWAAALKTAVDQLRRRVESWGAGVVAVTPDLPTDAAALSGRTLNLIPATERPDESPWRRWDVVVPLALIVILALAATALPLWQKRDLAIELARLADQARVQAGASGALRDELEQLTGDYNFALQRKYTFPAALQVVEDVTKILPDDTWLTQLEMKTTARGKDPHREIVLRGESVNAGRLVSLLEESKVFELAAPRSPTTKIQPGPGEIFDLGAQLKTLPLPQPTQLAEAPGSGATARKPRGPVVPPAAADAPTTAASDKADAPVAVPAAQPRTAAPAAAPAVEPRAAAPVAAPAAEPRTATPGVALPRPAPPGAPAPGATAPAPAAAAPAPAVPAPSAEPEAEAEEPAPDAQANPAARPSR